MSTCLAKKIRMLYLYHVIIPTNNQFSYHWALIIGPKLEKDKRGAMGEGKRYHARTRIHGWMLAEEEISLQPTNALLVRVLIGKIERKERVVDIIRKIPINKPEKPGWNCVIWIQEALEALKADGKALGTSSVEWTTIRDRAMWYVEEKKKEHRFDGKGNFNSVQAPTWYLLEGRETVK